LIFADESSAWKIAGLRQLDRLALALNDFLCRPNEFNSMPVCIFWSDQPSPDRRRLPQSQKLARLVLSDDVERFTSEAKAGDGQILFFNTHLVVSRGGFAQIFDEIETADAPALLLPGFDISLIRETNLRLTNRMIAQQPDVTSSPDIPGFRKWSYIRDAKEIPAAEKRLFLSTAKTQDGVIARWINRPISRVVSGWLVHLPLSPNQWTLALMAAPIAGSILLMRGDYLGAAIAAILFQLQSALDGCDGEIARVKYLESDWGHKLDGICDRLATMLLAIGIGVGLSRQTGISDSAGSFYLMEGILTALLIGVSETLLQRSTIEESLAREEVDNPYPNYVRSNQRFFNAGDHLKVWAIKNSGMLFLGERLTSFFVQLTKRDVFNFAFALFILCGRSRWVLHILAAVAIGISVMAMRNLLTMVFATQRRPPAASGD
jgi:hypothetical protein